MWLVVAIGLAGVASLIVAQAYTTAHRPVRREPQPKLLPGDEPEASPNNIGQRAFVGRDLIWSVVSAIGITIVLCSRLGMAWVENSGRDAGLIILAIAGGLLFGAGWIFGRPVRRSLSDFSLWMASGLVYGAIVGLGAYLFSRLGPYTEPPSDFTLSLPIISGSRGC